MGLGRGWIAGRSDLIVNTLDIPARIGGALNGLPIQAWVGSSKAGHSSGSSSADFSRRKRVAHDQKDLRVQIARKHLCRPRRVRWDSNRERLFIVVR